MYFVHFLLCRLILPRRFVGTNCVDDPHLPNNARKKITLFFTISIFKDASCVWLLDFYCIYLGVNVFFFLMPWKLWMQFIFCALLFGSCCAFSDWGGVRVPIYHLLFFFLFMMKCNSPILLSLNIKHERYITVCLYNVIERPTGAMIYRCSVTHCLWLHCIFTAQKRGLISKHSQWNLFFAFKMIYIHSIHAKVSRFVFGTFIYPFFASPPQKCPCGDLIFWSSPTSWIGILESQ